MIPLKAVDTKEYIESGILEAYVLDALTPEEKLRVARDIAQHPELAAEVRAIEEGMLAFAQAGAGQPPAFLKDHIWDAIAREQEGARPQTNVRPLSPGTAKPSWQRAAIWAAFLVSILTNFMLLSQRNKLKEERTAMQLQMDTVKRQQQFLADAVANYTREKEMLADTAMQPVIMKTMQPGHPMAATVYWSRQKGETYLVIQKMPPPPSGMQYQMWVIQDGKPVSMGVLSDDIVVPGAITRLPMQVTSGQAFAISLEKEGGSPTPTMEQIQVMGKPS